MKYLTIYFLLILISCLFLSQSTAFFTGDSEKKETKGQCSLYKGRCGGSIKNTCCKTPYKCSKQTKICGKDKLCCVSEADIQRHKQDSGSFLAQRGG